MGHIRLGAFYDPATNSVDWNSLALTCKYAVRYQDNIIDYTPYHLPENEENQKKERRVGIGSMGLATLLIKMNMRYGSDECIEFLDKLYGFITKHIYEASIDLAEEKGKFPACVPHKMAQSGFMRFLLPHLSKEHQEKFFRTGIRNVTLITQAPTGSTGTYIDNIEDLVDEDGNLLLELDNTTGIEPYFAFEYYRASRAGKVKQYAKIAKKYVNKHNVDKLPDYFVTAQDLSPEDHVKVQAIIQKWCDSSISKTANCPSDYTVEQVKKLYELAYDLGCKGVTIYRDGSRDAQVLSTDESKAVLETELEDRKLQEIKSKLEIENNGDITITSGTINITSDNVNKPDIEKRPRRLYGFVEKVQYMHGDKQGKAYVTITVDANNSPVEVFIECTDPSEQPMGRSLGRTITQFLRYGRTRDNVDQIVKHLQRGNTVTSLPAIIGRLLMGVETGKIEMPTFNKSEEKAIKDVKLRKCPDCGEEKYDKANCICYSCGSSHCN